MYIDTIWIVLHWFFSNRKHNSMDEVTEVTKKVKEKQQKTKKKNQQKTPL